MTYYQQLQAKIKEQKNTIEYITCIANNISNDEMTLRDLDSNSEELESACQMLKDITEEIIQLRLYVEFEEAEKEVNQYLKK